MNTDSINSVPSFIQRFSEDDQTLPYPDHHIIIIWFIIISSFHHITILVSSYHHIADRDDQALQSPESACTPPPK